MAGLNAGDVLQVTIRGAVLDQEVMTNLTYVVNTASTAGTYLTAMAAWMNDWLNSATGPQLSYLAAVAQNYTCIDIRGQRVWPTRDIALFKLDGRPGTRPTDAEAANLAGVITRHGPFGTRHDVTNLHLPAIADGDFIGGKLTAQQITRMGTLGTKLLNQITVPGEALTLDPVVTSRANLAAYRALIAFAVQDTVRVMRRRTLRIGI